jgi:hypothetical protein
MGEVATGIAGVFVQIAHFPRARRKSEAATFALSSFPRARFQTDDAFFPNR